MYATLIQKYGSKKVSVMLLVAILSVAVTVVGGHIDSYLKEEANRERKHTLTNTRFRIYSTQAKLDELEQFERANGVSAMSAKLRAELNLELEELEQTRNCLINSGDCMVLE